jgi:hypothetical protein
MYVQHIPVLCRLFIAALCPLARTESDDRIPSLNVSRDSMHESLPGLHRVSILSVRTGFVFVNIIVGDRQECVRF